MISLCSSFVRDAKSKRLHFATIPNLQKLSSRNRTPYFSPNYASNPRMLTLFSRGKPCPGTSIYYKSVHTLNRAPSGGSILSGRRTDIVISVLYHFIGCHSNCKLFYFAICVVRWVNN